MLGGVRIKPSSRTQIEAAHHHLQTPRQLTPTPVLDIRIIH
jgi:hypothetical protein